MSKRRIVVKIGSSSLTNKKGGLSKSKLTEHVEAIVQLRKQGHEVILISSGAVSAGFADLGYPARPVTTAGKQAAAAVGQGLLIQAYTEIFKQHGIVAAQLLLTRNDFYKKEQYSNAYATLSELLKRSVLPIINENDSVSIDELTFGDNDMLSALVSGLVHADFLMILTDINGLYDQDPRTVPTAHRYDFLSDITDDHIQMTNLASASKFGTGGMKSKLLASKTALSLGVNVFVGTGSHQEKLLHILDGMGDGTYIGNSPATPLKTQKQWLAFHSPISGIIEIDDGAAKAILFDGKSLLPAGIRAVSGVFSTGEVVEIINSAKEVIGKGQVQYSSEDLQIIKGLTSQEAMEKTKNTHPEVVHRNRWLSMIKERIV
ncbi:glutamate 5-kinase [Fictibacillus sp. KU28468]|uniref:glutamate 5-kinase n=1 Tax=Fictibacillus sp. KU28468 TaxID=2991053 RepID=UPI00223D073C|nr:glutamate 5-kinase [Fictibacillus sp. KU28468]UZJ76859.1 glutamate 5-kinase [Fictibacillus sp. KU28468]